jgi:predicted ArsR family transcriptional regulator
VKSRGALQELSQVEWRVFVALATSERPASARAVGEAVEGLGFKLDPNAVRVYLSKCVAKGYAKVVDPPGGVEAERERGRPPQLFYEPAKNLRPAVERQFRRWLAEWAIPETAEEWILEMLRPAPKRKRGGQKG